MTPPTQSDARWEPPTMIGVCTNRDHSWWFPVESSHERCPEQDCDAKVAFYRLLATREALERGGDG